jgi:hypothetical protein
MRGVRLLLLAAVAGCASSGGENIPPGTTQTTSVNTGTGQTIHVRSTPDRPSKVTVPLSVAMAWKALPDIYKALGIPIAVLDSVQHQIGNTGLRARGRLGGVPMQRYFDCGSTQGGPNAETYELHISVLTDVDDTAEGTVVTTAVQAAGKPITFSGDYSRCSSTGSIETKIAGELKKLAP